MMIRRRRDKNVPIGEPTEPETGAPLEIEDSRPTPEHEYAQLELRSVLMDLLLQLRPALRAVILLRELRDFSTAEAADALGISVSAVKTRLFHARLKLRKALDGDSRLGIRSAAGRLFSRGPQTAQP